MAAQPHFRAGMVGAGNICEYHVAAVQALPDVELVGICDLDRRRATVEDRLPERSQQQTLRALGDEQLNQLVTAYVDAWENGDVDT